MMISKGKALLFVDRLLTRFGWQRIFRVSMLPSGGVFAICLIVPSKVTSGEGRTVLEFGELPSYIVAPLITGLLAEWLGLGWALVAVVLSLGLCYLLSFKIREARLVG